MAHQETLLKREFKKRDVTRARNLLHGRYSERTGIQSGHEAVEVVRVEGDIWEQDGKLWKIRDGIKVRVNKFSEDRRLNKIPLCCPQCGGSLSGHLNRESYRFYGFCYDPCLVEFEADLEDRGLYDSFVRARTEGNHKFFKKELLGYLSDIIGKKSNFVTAAGDIEDWVGDFSERDIRFKRNVSRFIEQLDSKE